jgi:hypothetical protein
VSVRDLSYEVKNPEYPVGLRVMVYSPSRRRIWGKGTITKVEPLYMECEDGRIIKVLDEYTAEITLDNGKKTEGLKCWWYPLNRVEHSLVIQ